MAALITGVVTLAGTGLAFVASRRPAPDGSPRKDWLPTRAEAKSIAEPLASILLRHGPSDELGNAGDLVDGINVVTGVGGFALRAAEGDPGGRIEKESAPTPQETT